MHRGFHRSAKRSWPHEMGARLDALGAGPADFAMTQGACGADLLFAEAMLKRGAALQLHLPLDEETFISPVGRFQEACVARARPLA